MTNVITNRIRVSPKNNEISKSLIEMLLFEINHFSYGKVLYSVCTGRSFTDFVFCSQRPFDPPNLDKILSYNDVWLLTSDEGGFHDCFAHLNVQDSYEPAVYTANQILINGNIYKLHGFIKKLLGERCNDSLLTSENTLLCDISSTFKASNYIRLWNENGVEEVDQTSIIGESDSSEIKIIDGDLEVFESIFYNKLCSSPDSADYRIHNELKSVKLLFNKRVVKDYTYARSQSNPDRFFWTDNSADYWDNLIAAS
ncbi:hypothetical protein ACJJJB_09870 [Microbulbifer sp. ANSA001]|uniref:hypothetical protein n=1 Tax=Microbulbifer sp. ANSA001 TaxID=3243358 RepID=UPI0040434072